LLDVGQLAETFDLVVCSGVLHHLEDPDKGLRALAEVIAPGGVFVGMVYATAWRTGVYMLQEAFRRLGIGQDSDGVAFVRETLKQTPPWHFVRLYAANAAELKHDAAVVDTFLHTQDRSYTVSQVLALVEGAGLHLQAWFDNAMYYPDAALSPGAALYDRISALPEREQWIVTELIAPRSSRHSFVARREPWRPRTPPLQWVAHAALGLSKISDGQYKRANAKLAFTPQQGALLDAMDGERTIEQIAAHAGADAAAAQQFFTRAWRQGHVMLAEAPRSLYYASSSTSQ
jgi:hypothetical protein